MSLKQSNFDAVIVGGGHNGLVAAAYLAKAGKKVLLLEQNDYIGGATTSQRIFPDFDANLSRYAYLVSLLPDKIIQDLGLSLQLRRRETASFTPFQRNEQPSGLLLSNSNEAANQQQIEKLYPGDYAGYRQMLALEQLFSEKVWDSFLEPLRPKTAWEKQFNTPEEKKAWRFMIEQPIGHFIEEYVQDDILRGVLLTDAKIGAYTHAHDPSLLQNRTFLYHIVGNKTGEWRVPVGGMGAVVEALKKAATSAGAQLLTEAAVTHLHLGADTHTIAFTKEHKTVEVKAKYVLVNASPETLGKLTKTPYTPTTADTGTAFKVNMLLRRLPPLKAEGVKAEQAFAGTFHINQGYSQLAESYRESAAHQVPSLPPCEIYCHTLTDSSILSPQLVREGYQTLTLFGLDMPYHLFTENPEAVKKQVLHTYLCGINAYLEEPIEDCLARAADGSLCIEAKSAWDLEKEVGLPRGNIFHKALSWFFAENEGEAGSWGVETSHERLYICGSSAKRGGAVSGIPGYNAAMKVLKG
ncbi:MAG: NAD(P)/FAD-dependent oxidoreductase [Spirosomataceae bacterium]